MIEARIEDVVAGDGMLVLRPLQDQVAEEGCHDYGGDPGDQQGQAHHGEDAERVLAGSRLRRADGQKTRRRDQRAGEHGESRAAPGEGGGGKLAQALLDLARHHLDGDHGVVDQQAQRDDQRPGGNAVQVDAEVAHAEKGRRHHPGNGDGHHQAGAQAQAEEAHHQHDGQRLEEHAHEVAHRRLDDARLVGHLGELDADRQVGMNRRHFAVEVLAQLEHVAVLDHGHRQADRLLAAEIHLGDRRIDVVAVDPRDVTDAQAASGHRHARVGHRSHRVQFAGDAQGNGMGRGIHGAGRHHGVLRRQRLADSLRIEAQRCQLLLRQLDEDAVVLDADEVDLGDVLQLQQALARRLDMIAQLGMREAVRGESVDGAEDIAELVVVERPDDALRQGAADVADLLAHLVPGVGHRLAARRVVQLQDDERLARLGVAARVAEEGHLLQFLLDALGHLPVHLLRRGPRPHGAHDHGAEGEVGVFALAQFEVGSEAGNGDDEDEEQRQLAVAQRRGGEVEAAVGVHLKPLTTETQRHRGNRKTEIRSLYMLFSVPLCLCGEIGFIISAPAGAPSALARAGWRRR